MMGSRRKLDWRGLTIVEVVVAMALLAILGASLVALLPQLSRNTRAATEDTTLSNVVYGVFERLGSDWSNVSPWSAESVFVGETLVPLADFVDAETGGACDVDVQPTQGGILRRVTITCAGDVGPAVVLRAEYGTPE